MFCFYIFFNPNSLFTTCRHLYEPHKPPDGNRISTKHSPRAFTPDKLNVLMTVFECYKYECPLLILPQTPCTPNYIMPFRHESEISATDL